MLQVERPAALRELRAIVCVWCVNGLDWLRMSRTDEGSETRKFAVWSGDDSGYLKATKTSQS
jgi:hypothetical protein